MSFPITSIAVVNSVLFGAYSHTLLVLTATSHQERRAQPPSYTHVFIAGCIGGFLQVRAAALVCPFLPLPAPSGDPRLQTRAFSLESGGRWGNGQLLLLPLTWPG